MRNRCPACNPADRRLLDLRTTVLVRPYLLQIAFNVSPFLTLWVLNSVETTACTRGRFFSTSAFLPTGTLKGYDALPGGVNPFRNSLLYLFSSFGAISQASATALKEVQRGTSTVSKASGGS